LQKPCGTSRRFGGQATRDHRHLNFRQSRTSRNHGQFVVASARGCLPRAGFPCPSSPLDNVLAVQRTNGRGILTDDRRSEVSGRFVISTSHPRWRSGGRRAILLIVDTMAGSSICYCVNICDAKGVAAAVDLRPQAHGVSCADDRTAAQRPPFMEPFADGDASRYRDAMAVGTARTWWRRLVYLPSCYWFGD